MFTVLKRNYKAYCHSPSPFPPPLPPSPSPPPPPPSSLPTPLLVAQEHLWELVLAARNRSSVSHNSSIFATAVAGCICSALDQTSSCFLIQICVCWRRIVVSVAVGQCNLIPPTLSPQQSCIKLMQPSAIVCVCVCLLLIFRGFGPQLIWWSSSCALLMLHQRVSHRSCHDVSGALDYWTGFFCRWYGRYKSWSG